MKWLKLIALILLAPLALMVLFGLLGFIVLLSPALVLCFAVFQVCGVFKNRNENRVKLEYKLKTNKDLLRFEYKKYINGSFE